jgi:hypothetical protein
MRIGSLEITAMLAAVALIAARPRVGNSAEIASLVPVKAVLRVIELGRERIFEGLCPLSVGRDRSCELVLADVEVSRKHARLEAQGGVVFVSDLEIRNGTLAQSRCAKATRSTWERPDSSWRSCNRGRSHTR